MPTVRIPFGAGHAILTHQDGWKPGDQPPSDPNDYLGWHAWAEIQYKAKLRQKQCGRCRGWKFPQELSGKMVERSGFTNKAMTKSIKWSEPLCNKCDGLTSQQERTT